MANPPKKPKTDDDKFKATVKRLLSTPPKPHKPKAKLKKKAKKG